MGREWYWGRGEKESSGCMSGMLHFLDFHHLLFTGSGAQVHRPPHQHKGVEAPRNSLELDQTVASTSSMGDDLKFYDVPLGIQLVPAAEAKRKKKLSSVLEEEKRNSQAGTPRTPNVVARLMGLEALPELAASPSIHGQRLVETAEHYQKKQQKKKPCMDEYRTNSPSPRQPLQPRNCNALPQLRMDGCSRSLPDSPRVSSARSWDADPRLSLQLNKENYSNRAKEFTYLCEAPADCSLSPSPSPHMTKSRKKSSSRDQDENKCPRSHSYAREIVRQVKESISNRRSGGNGGCGEENAAISRRTRPPEKKASPYRETRSQSKPSEVKPSPPWSPPMIRFSEPPKTKLTPQDEDNTPKLPVPTKPLRPTPTLSKKAIKIDARECNKASNSNERYTERIKKSPSPPDAIAATQHQFPRSDKKKSGPSPSLVAAFPILPPGQIRRSFFSPVQEQVDEQWRRDPEFRYVRSILEHAGIMTKAVYMMKWYSRSLPIDPTIFHQLELELPLCNEGTSGGTLRHPWNRKLLFHLVSELLGDLMPTTTHLISNRERWRGGGESVLLRLWSQIRSFPSADCRIVGDIDAVVEADLPEAKIRGLLRHPSVAEQAEDIAFEIEQNIFDSLVAEAAASLALLQCSRLQPMGKRVGVRLSLPS